MATPLEEQTLNTTSSVLKNVPGVQREPWESRYHWLCRRKFIEDHKNVHSIKRAVCLSMVWANMNFMENHYSKGVEDSVSYYPVPDQSEVERWLDAHSDIQEEDMSRRREKGEECKVTGKRTLSRSGIEDEDNDDSVPTKRPNIESNIDNPMNYSELSSQLNTMISSIRKNQDTSQQKQMPSSTPTLSVDSRIKDDPKWKKMIKLLSCWCLCSKCYAGDRTNSIASLHVICDKSKVALDFVEDPETNSVSIHVNNFCMSSFSSSTMKEAKRSASQALMNEISQRQIETQFECPATGRRVVEMEDFKINPQSEERISESNKGHQLLVKMGWNEEQGLGTHGQGKQDPVVGTFRSQRSREGLGGEATESRLPRQSVETMLREFVTSSESQLEFSSDLSNEDRKAVHIIAEQYNLIHKSMGSGPNRFLVVSKKTGFQYDANTGDRSYRQYPMQYGNEPRPSRHGNQPGPWNQPRPMRHGNQPRPPRHGNQPGPMRRGNVQQYSRPYPKY